MDTSHKNKVIHLWDELWNIENTGNKYTTATIAIELTLTVLVTTIDALRHFETG